MRPTWACRTLLFGMALVLIQGLGAPPSAWAQRVVFVVRHAEKVDESADPPLSPAGQARAESLARLLGTAAVTAIYVTELQRTRLTAVPLAAARGLTPITVRANASHDLIDRIRKDQPNGVVLVVGHSNTVPEILKWLGHPDPVEIKPDEYDGLFVAVPRGSGPPTVVRLRY